MAGIFVLGICLSLSASAQWISDLSKNLLVSEEGKTNQDLVCLGETTDGGVYISWISWEKDNYYLKLQLLDKDGNSRFAPGGIYVCKQPTPTWSSGYGFRVTKDNNAVFLITDMRNSEWQAYAYKISPEGEHLWSPEGIAVMKSGEGAALNPKIMETNAGNYIIGYRSMGAGVSKLSFLKMNTDGTTSWGSKLNIVGAGDLFDMVPAGNDGFIVSYFENNSYYAQRYNATGEEVWDNRAEIDNTETAKVTSEPVVVSDGEDGLVAGWRYAASQFTTGGRVLRINAEGESTFSDAFETGNLPFVSVDPGRKQIYIFSSDPVASSVFAPKAWKLDYQGTNLWSSEGVSLSDDGLSYAAYGIAGCANGDAVCIYRNGSNYNVATIEYTRISEDGTVTEQNKWVSSAVGDKGRGGCSTVKNGQIITAWTDMNSTAGGAVFAQNTVVEDPTDNCSLQSVDSQMVAFVTGREHLFLTISSSDDTEAFVSLVGLNGEIKEDFGKIVLRSGKNEMNYQMKGIAAGVYLLTVKTQKEIRTLKVVIR